jgi:acyl-CoA thioester hydrolase
MTEEFAFMNFPTPFEYSGGEVLPEWIDYNGHMNLAYYIVLFDQATDALFDRLDLGLAYRRDCNLGTFVAEMHTRYERELLVGERVRVTVQIVAADEKRLHVAHEMFRLATGERSATLETMFLHVSLTERRVTPFPPDLKARVDAATAAHASLPLPDWVGRRVAMPR